MEKKKWLELVRNVALNAALLEAIFLLVVLFIIIILSVFPVLVGADYTFKIIGRSMNPVLIEGDTILIKRGIENIEVGDIITFRANTNRVDSMIVTEIITHRVVAIQRNPILIFQTKGDIDDTPDPWRITPDQVIGKLTYIIPTNFLRTPFGFFASITLPASVVLLRIVYSLVKKKPIAGLFLIQDYIFIP
jgi:signal peptidase